MESGKTLAMLEAREGEGNSKEVWERVTRSSTCHNVMCVMGSRHSHYTLIMASILVSSNSLYGADFKPRKTKLENDVS